MAGSRVVILAPGAEASHEAARAIAPRADSLNGKVVALLANGWRSLDTTYDEFRELLYERYQVAEIIDKRKGGSSPLPLEDLEDVARRADVAVSGLGN